MYNIIRTCLVWTCLTSVSLARDIYVDNILGDDRLQGSSAAAAGPEGPVRSIAKALRLAQSGDRISIANTAEPYREAVSLTGQRHSGSETGPFVIDGNGATLDGSWPVNPDAWTYDGGDVFSFLPARLGYQQLFIGDELRLAVRHPVAAASVSLPPLAPREWCLWSGRIWFRVGPGHTPADYDLACCRLQTGITLYHVRNVVIENLTIQGYHVDGCAAADGVGWAVLRNLNCRANGRSGISVGGSSRVEIERCTLELNGGAQLRTDEYSHTSLVESKLLDTTAQAILHKGGEVSIDGRRAFGGP